jgi:aspartate racemase
MIDFKPTFFKKATDTNEMMCYLDEYEMLLKSSAKKLQSQGVKVRDQVFECCAFSMVSNNTQDKHVLLLGGMGPLAGVHGAKDVINMIGNSASITLFQACGIPERRMDTEVPQYLLSAFNSAIKLCPGNKKIELIVLCNSAHKYIQDIISHSNFQNKLIFYSFIDGVKKYSDIFFDKKSIVLQTDFTAQKRLYAGIKNLYSLDDIKDLKMQKEHRSQIIEGVKSFNQEKILKHGVLLLRALKKQGFNKILLGCTELPVAIECIKTYADKETINLLDAFEFVNPLHLVLQQLEQPKEKTG